MPVTESAPVSLPFEALNPLFGIAMDEVSATGRLSLSAPGNFGCNASRGRRGSAERSGSNRPRSGEPRACVGGPGRRATRAVSATLEARGALAEEGGDALLGVLGGERGGKASLLG